MENSNVTSILNNLEKSSPSKLLFQYFIGKPFLIFRSIKLNVYSTYFRFIFIYFALRQFKEQEILKSSEWQVGFASLLACLSVHNSQSIILASSPLYPTIPSNKWIFRCLQHSQLLAETWLRWHTFNVTSIQHYSIFHGKQYQRTSQARWINIFRDYRGANYAIF